MDGRNAGTGIYMRNKENSLTCVSDLCWEGVGKANGLTNPFPTQITYGLQPFS